MLRPSGIPPPGGCYDSLAEDRPNCNQGAESLLSWYVSALALEGYKKALPQ